MTTYSDKSISESLRNKLHTESAWTRQLLPNAVEITGDSVSSLSTKTTNHILAHLLPSMPVSDLAVDMIVPWSFHSLSISIIMTVSI